MYELLRRADRRAGHRDAAAQPLRGDRRVPADSLSREVFGESLYNSFIDLKRAEWESYASHVSAWETERYLKFF